MDLEKAVGLYLHKEKAEAPDTDPFTLEGPKVKEGKMVKLTHATMIDYTTVKARALLGIKDDAGKIHYIEHAREEMSSECHLQGEVYLLEGEKVIGHIVDPTLDDEIYFTAHGLIYDVE